MLDLSFPGENDVSAGDTIAVVVDPDDPSYVIAVNSHDDWAYTNWGNLIILAGIGVLGGGLWLGWALAVPRRAARKAGRRARAVHLVECVDVDGVQLTLRDGNGRLWTWTADETEWSGGRPAKVHVVGDLEPASRPVVAAGRSLHWPDAPVRPAGND